jgi:Fe2+ transport system protein FeoA
MTTYTKAEKGQAETEPQDISAEWLRLDKIEPSHCGIVRLVRAGESEIDRLKSMGLCEGRKIMMIKAGDPMIVRVLGSRIGISARLAHNVLVLPCAGDYFGQT